MRARVHPLLPVALIASGAVVAIALYAVRPASVAIGGPSESVATLTADTAPDASTIEIALDVAREPSGALVRSSVGPEPSEPERPPDPDAWVLVTAVSRVDARPIAGVRVSAYDRNGVLGKLADGAPTGRDGRTEIAVRSGVPLLLFAEEHVPNAGVTVRDLPPLKAGERHDFFLDVSPGDDGHACTRVVACDGRSPIPGAMIQVCRRVNASAVGLELIEEVLLEGSTDLDGRYEFDYSSTRQVYLRVLAPGFGTILAGVDRERTTAVDPQIVCIEPSASLTAEVMDASGVAVVAAEVRLKARPHDIHDSLWLPNRDAMYGLDWNVQTDAEGRAHFADLPAGVPLHARVLLDERPGQLEDKVAILKPGETRALRWTLGVGCRVEGLVLDQAGEPVANAEVVLRRSDKASRRGNEVGFGRSEEAFSDTDGKFVLEDVTPGTWWVTPISTRREPDLDRAIAGVPIAIDVDAQTRSQQLVLRVHRGLVIEGRVLDPERRPTAASVHAREDSGLCDATANVVADGAFRLGPLIPGRYRLTASSRLGDASSAPVWAVAGQADVELSLRVGGSLSGRVVDADTGQPCDADVTATLRDGKPRKLATWMDTNTSPGSFTVRGLEPGWYDIRAVTSNRTFGEALGVRVEGGSETRDVTVRAEPGGELRLRCDAPAEGGTFEVVRDGFDLPEVTLRRGVEFAYAVPPGEITVRFMGRGATEARVQTVDVAAGQSRPIVFEKDP